MWLFALLLACIDSGDPDVVEPAAAQVYIDGMWAQRALTVFAGLDEAVVLHAAGEREAAQALAMDVYRGSFEPELEPLLREQVDPRLAAEVEYRFGLVRDAMGGRREQPVQDAVAALRARLEEGAGRLDAARAVMD